MADSIEIEASADDDDLEEKLWLASRGQKAVIYCIVLNFLLGSVAQGHALSSLAIYALSLVFRSMR